MSDCTPKNLLQHLVEGLSNCNGENINQILDGDDIPPVEGFNLITEGGDDMITEITLNNIILE